MYYVLSGYGYVEEEFETFEEADAYLEAHGTEDMWISSDEDDEPSYNEDEGFDPYMGDYTWDC